MSRSHFLVPLLDSGSQRPVLVRDSDDLVIATHLDTAFDSDARRRGLLGHSSLPEGHALVIAPCNAVHTLFMKFAIDVVFADRGGRVLKAIEGLKPWRLSACVRAFATIELPAGTIRRRGLKRGDRLVARVGNLDSKTEPV